jgi:hypothetical protein
MVDLRKVIDALMPEGVIWDPKIDEGLDQLLDGVAGNAQTVYDFISSAAFIRDPKRTPVLRDLEHEYGVRPNPVLSEADRREGLIPIVYARKGTGSKDDLQNKLQDAGFTNLYVTENSPRTDPARFLNGGFPAMCGRATGGFGGKLLVNGALYTSTVDYLHVCGNSKARCGDARAMCGTYSGVTKTEIKYKIPTDSAYWPLIFFVGGEAVQNPVETNSTQCGADDSQCGDTEAICRDFRGEIKTIEFVNIPPERYGEVVNIILKTKPIHSWCLLLVPEQPIESPIRYFDGTVSAQSTTSAALDHITCLDGTVDGQVTADADLEVVAPVDGDADGQAGVDGDVKIIANITGTVDAQSSATCTITHYD